MKGKIQYPVDVDRCADAPNRTDGDRFVAGYQAALEDARETLELGPVFEVVERWRRIAILQTDPTGYRRTVRLAAELAIGEPSPEDEPLEATSTKAGM